MSNRRKEDLTIKLNNRTPTKEELNNNDLVCSICLDEFEEDQNLSEFKECKHLFHKECIEQWIQTKGTCPMCRHEMDLQQSNRVINADTGEALIRNTHYRPANRQMHWIGDLPIFINGRRLSGALPFEQFRRLIDEELSRYENRER